MRQMLKMWNDDCGSTLVTSEILFIFVLLFR